MSIMRYQSSDYEVIGYATGLTIGDRFLEGVGTFHFIATSRPALGPTQLPIQWLPELFPLR
jgi:hypothetical protein